MNLPGQQPDFDPFDDVRLAYQVFGEVDGVINEVASAAMSEVQQLGGEVAGTVAAIQQTLYDQIASPQYEAGRLVEEMRNEALLTAETLAADAVGLSAELEQFRDLAPTAPQPGADSPPVTPPTRTSLQPPTSPLTSPPTGPTPTRTFTPFDPSIILPPPPPPAVPPPPTVTPPPAAFDCAAISAMVPWGQPGVFTVWQLPFNPSLPPGSLPGYAVLPGGELPPQGSSSVSGYLTPDAVALTLSQLTGCVIVAPPVPQPEPQPTPEPEPQPTPEPEPPPIPQPDEIPPPTIPEECGGGNLVLPECYYWTDSCGPGNWALWYDPASCQMFRVACGCDANAGCPPRAVPWILLGNVGIRPPIGCTIEGVVGPSGIVSDPPVPSDPAVLPPSIPPIPSQHPPTGPAPQPGVFDLDWNSLRVCETITDLISGPDLPRESLGAYHLGLIDADANPVTPQWVVDISSVLGQLALPSVTRLFQVIRYVIAQALPFGANQQQLDAYWQAATDDPLLLVRADTLAEIFRSILGIATGMQFAALSSIYSPPTAYALFATLEQVLGLISGWTGINLDNILRRISYVTNYIWPHTIPSVSEANSALLNGQITDELWECWVKANGTFPVPARQVMEGQRTKPGPLDVIRLDMRQLLTPEQLAAAKRSAGFRNDVDYARLWALQQQIPTPSEVILFMGRDADDKDIVQTFRTDEQFNDKYGPKLREWAEQNGLTDEHMQYLWRSHWKIPSPTQLFEMVHRHRHREPNDPLFTDLDLVKKALSQDDVLPFWQDRLVSVAYLPINWTRMIEAYVLNVINTDQVRDRIYHQGYNDEDTEILVELATRQRDRRQGDERNLPTVRDATSGYVSGRVDRKVAVRWITDRGYTELDAERSLDAALEKDDAEKRGRKIEALRQRFRHGELDLTAAQSELVRIGLAESDATRIVGHWSDQLSIREKHITVRYLCKMLTYNIITVQDYFDRLQRLGYTETDANNFIRSCQADIAKAAAKEAEKRARESARKNRR